MKKILVVTLMLVMTASNCLAMTFSQPVEIGRTYGDPNGGIYIKGATENNGELYQNPRIKNNTEVYKKGIARFGEGITAIYFHYNFDYVKQGYDAFVNNGAKFGGKDPSNTVALVIEEGWSCNISRIPNDKGKTLYLLFHQGCVAGNETYIIFDVKSDGKFIKMIDTRSVVEKYLGANKMHMRGVYLDKLYCKDDTIIIPYNDYNKETRRTFKAGEFRFKWDESAQWFGVEHIIY